MTSLNWARWTGVATILGGTMWIGLWVQRASMPVAAPGGSRPGGEAFDFWNVVSIFLFVLGLTGANSLQAKQAGMIGKATIGLTWTGFALMGVWVLGFADPYLLFVGGAIALLTGAALFCVATLRAGMLPRAAVVPLIIGVLLFPLVNPEDRRAFLAVPLGIGWVGLGYFLWRVTPNHR